MCRIGPQLQVPSSAATQSSRRMNSLGSCCRLFRQTVLANKLHCAGVQAQTRRAFALPKAALRGRQTKERDTVATDDVAANKVRSPSQVDKSHQVTSLPMTVAGGAFHVYISTVICLCVALGESLGTSDERPQLSLWARYYHAAWTG